MKAYVPVTVEWEKSNGAVNIKAASVAGKSILKVLDEKILQDIKKDLESEEDNSGSEVFEIELELEVDHDITKGSKDYFDKGHGNYLPGDPDDITINSATINGIDVWDELSADEQERIETKLLQDGLEENMNESTGKFQLYANPYNKEKSGFYFSTMKEYEDNYKKNLPTEEYEIDFINGSAEDIDLWKVLQGKINQNNLEVWFDQIADLSTEDKAKLFFLVDYRGENPLSAVDEIDDVNLYHQSLEDYAFDYPENVLGITDKNKEYKFFLTYFNYKAFANDLNLSGDMREFEFAGETYCADNNF